MSVDDDRSKLDHLITASFAYQEASIAGSDFTWKEQYEQLRDAFNGRYFKNTADMNRYVVNTIWSLINLVVPNLFFDKPYIKVRAQQQTAWYISPTGDALEQDAVHNAEVMEAALNTTLQAISAFPTMQSTVQDCMLSGTGITKVGYTHTFSTDDADTDGTIFCTRINPYDFGAHPLSQDPDTAPLLVHRLVKTTEELRAAKLQHVTEQGEELPKHVKDLLDLFPLAVKNAVMDGTHVIYECHDQRKNKVQWMGESPRDIMGTIVRPYRFAGSDFSTLTLSKDNDSLFGQPILAYVYDLALSLNDLLTKAMHHVELFPGRVFVEEGALTEDQLEQLRNGGQGAIQTVNAGTISNGKMQFTNPMALGSDTINLIGLVQNLIDRVLGVPDFQRPGTNSRKTATEASFEQGDAQIRREWYRNKVKTFILENVRKISGLIQQFQLRETTVPSFQGANSFVTVSPETLVGNFSFNFDLDNLRFVTEAQAQQLINFLNIVASHPILQPMMKDMDPLKVAKQLMRSMDINLDSITLSPGQAPAFTPQTPGATQPTAIAGQQRPDILSKAVSPQPGETQQQATNL